MKLWCLHGNFGLPTDWDFLRAHLKQNTSRPVKCEAVDLWKDPGLSDRDSPTRWAERFCDKVGRDNGKGQNILLGYSLGGRLGMHAIAYDPSLWLGAIIISAHPGLQSSEQREARRKSDEEWAQHCEDPSFSWKALLGAWNAQTVLQNESQISRPEEAFDRRALAKAFRAWSVANMKTQVEDLAQSKVNSLWVVGEKDQKFVRLAEERVEGKFSTIRLEMAPNVGHRVPWAAPDWFGCCVSDTIEEFISSL